MAGDAEDRTEAPTQKRLDEARESGQVPLSREAVNFATLGAATLALMFSLPSVGEALLQHLTVLLADAGSLRWEEAAPATLKLFLRLVLPVLAVAAAAAAAATLLQIGLPASAHGLQPRFDKLNPIGGLKRLFGLEHLVEVLRTVLKIALVGAALWHVAGDVGPLLTALDQPAPGLLAVLCDSARRLVLAALGSFFLLAGFDLFWVRLRLIRQLRMSREDLKQEMRESEGDPQIKARLRRLRLVRAKRRMLAAVPKATVVVTNPTHYAVALLYEQGKPAAPKVVAKGVDAAAARIRALADEHRVPIVSNPPLARALFKVEPDTEIPAEHYQAVAEIIAYVLRLRSRTRAAA